MILKALKLNILLFLFAASVKAAAVDQKSCAQVLILTHEKVHGLEGDLQSFIQLHYSNQIDGRIFSSSSHFQNIWNLKSGLKEYFRLELKFVEKLAEAQNTNFQMTVLPSYNGPVRKVSHSVALTGIIWYIIHSPAFNFSGEQFIELVNKFLKFRDNVRKDNSIPDYGIIDLAIVFHYFSRWIVGLEELQIIEIKNLFLQKLDSRWKRKHADDLQAVLNKYWGPTRKFSTVELQAELQTLQRVFHLLDSKLTRAMVLQN